LIQSNTIILIPKKIDLKILRWSGIGTTGGRLADDWQTTCRRPGCYKDST